MTSTERLKKEVERLGKFRGWPFLEAQNTRLLIRAEKAEADKAKLVEALAGMLESYDVLMRFIPGSDSGTVRGMVIGAFIHEPTKARAVLKEVT